MIRIRIFVSGSVQGVGYRWFASREATALGLSGYAKNLTHGAVEVEVQGEEAGIASFVEKLHKGPSGAIVTTLAQDKIEPIGGEVAFEIY